MSSKKENCVQSLRQELLSLLGVPAISKILWKGDQIQDNINISQQNADVYADFAKAVTKEGFCGQDRK